MAVTGREIQTTKLFYFLPGRQEDVLISSSQISQKMEGIRKEVLKAKSHRHQALGGEEKLVGWAGWPMRMTQCDQGRTDG